MIDDNSHLVEDINNNTRCRNTAYVSTDNKKMTIVILNITQDMDINLKLAIKNFASAKGAIYRTSETENCVYVGEFNKRKPLVLPANSITTLSLSTAEK